MTTLNVNSRVRVRLTDHGKRQYFMNYCDPKEALEDVPDVLEAQLHELMLIFSDQMYMGNPHMMFEGNQIEVLR